MSEALLAIIRTKSSDDDDVSLLKSRTKLVGFLFFTLALLGFRDQVFY
jgi:hypothetical protein